MKKIVEVYLEDENRIVFLDSNNFDLFKDEYVIFQGETATRIGQVVRDSYEIDDSDVGKLFSVVIRKATNSDIDVLQKNMNDAHEALLHARKIAVSLNLNMNIIDAVYSYDRSQLLYHFLADTRIDFRELAKKLAQIYKTRIELRQIGVRDKAKIVGGLGPCGRFLCCSSFLTDFSSVSINMAKNQMLALNPTKINGICGRLLCCLGYEDDIYTELKKDMPLIGQTFKNEEVEGKIVSMNVLKKTITVETVNKSIIEVKI